MSEALGRRIAIGADHGGFALKEHLRKRLIDRGFEVKDCGVFDPSPADYPVVAAAVARQVSEGSADAGILLDGAGIGSCMVANKLPGVRAAMCYDVSTAANSREHNDANVLTLGARLIGEGLAEQIVETWLSKECTEERHRRRVGLIGQIERGVLAEAVDRTDDSRRRAGMERTPHPGPLPQGKGELSAPAEQREHRKLDGEAIKTTVDNLRKAPDLVDLSNEDLERIARRIVELAGAEGVREGILAPAGFQSAFPAAFLAACQCACCGPGCNGHCAEKNPETVRGLIGMGASRIGHGLGGGPIARDVAKYIDHTLLKPEATRQQIEQLCKEALDYGFASVCVNPSYVRLCAHRLKGSSVAVCTVAGFPLGAHVAEIKALEARRAIREGAREIDMVINIGALKSGDDDVVYHDVRSVVEACQDGRAICKVIIECALLTDEEKVRACRLAKRARADFVKTSTGFSTGGATAQDVALMSEAVRGTRMGVKAAGGIRSIEVVQKMVQAGATRIGASAGVQIVQAAKGATVSEGGSAAAAGTKGAKEPY